MVPYTPPSHQLYQKQDARGSQSFRSLTFSGADSRSSWWGAQLLILFIYLVGAVVFEGTKSEYGFLLLALCTVACAYLSLASGTRRLHDRGKSGLWMLLALIPLGNIWLFIELGFLPGDGA